MPYRRVMLLGALAAVVSVPLAGQAPQAAGSAAPTSWTLGRTAWGNPDLQGIWRNLVQNMPF